MSLAKRIQARRKEIGLTLDELAEKADISKTYLWELEADTKGAKRPSADVLVRIADALSTTIADLMALPVVTVDDQEVPLTQSLIAFREFMKRKMKQPLPESDLRDLARMRFRGGQPKSSEDWYDLYRALKRSTGE